MHCDNHCPRCGEADEYVSNAIFECSPDLQAWDLSSTPSHLNTFRVLNVYTNLNHLLWRENYIKNFRVR